jgi:aldehyde dehydrogenase (NAD+)
MKAYTDLKTTFYSGRTKDLRWRAEQLTAIERMMSERESDFIDALNQDLGKHALESWMTEISYVTDTAAYCRKNLRRWTRSKRISTPAVALPAKSWVQPEPLGVVLVNGAWK